MKAEYFLLNLIAIAVGSSITQVAPMTDITVSYMDGGSIDLSNFFEGENLSFSGGSITYGAVTESSIHVKSASPSAFGSVQLYHPYAFISSDSNIQIWDISETTSPQLITSIPLKQNASILDMFLSGQTLLVTSQHKSSVYFDSYAVTEAPSLELTKGMSLEIGKDITDISHYADSYIFLCIGSQEIVSVDFFQNSTLPSINATSIGVDKFAPVSIGFSDNSGVICDEINGLFSFDLNPFLGSGQLIISNNQFVDTINSCHVSSASVLVGTDSGIEIYFLPYLKFQKKIYSASKASSRLFYNRDLISGYFKVGGSEHFKLIDSVTSEILIDTKTKDIFGKDSAPIYSLFRINSELFGIYSSSSHIGTFRLYQNAYFEIERDYKPFVKSGTITVKNDSNKLKAQYTVAGIDPLGMSIRPYRGMYPSSDYLRSYNISILLHPNFSRYSLYIPLSNYLSGQNLNYTLEVNSIPSKYNITVINPLNYIETDESINETTEGNGALVSYELNGWLLLLAISGESNIAEVYKHSQTDGLDLSDTVFCSEYAKKAVDGIWSNILGIDIFAVKCVSEVGIEWNFYSFTGSSQKIGTISNSTDSLGTFLCSRFLHLMGNSIYVYRVNSTDISREETVIAIQEYQALDITAGDSCENFIVYTSGDQIIQFNINTPEVFSLIYEISLNAGKKYMRFLNGYLYGFNPEWDTDPINICEIEVYDGKLLKGFPGDPAYDISSAQNLIFILMRNEEGNNSTVYIWDPFATVFEGIYDTIEFQGLCEIADLILKPYYLFVYCGNKIYQFEVNEGPVPRKSVLVPPEGIKNSYWSEMMITNEGNSSETQKISFSIIGENSSYRNESTILLNINNRGSIVDINPKFNKSAFLITQENAFNVKGPFSEIIPLDAFIGNNVFYFVYNKVRKYQYPHSLKCDNDTIPICVESKAGILNSIEEYALSYSYLNKNLVVAVPNFLVFYSVIGQFSNKERSMNLASLLGESDVYCNNIKYLPLYSDILVLGCATENTTSKPFLVLIDTLSSNKTNIIEQTLPILDIYISEDNDYIYIYNRESIQTYSWAGYKLKLASTITSQTLSSPSLDLASLFALNDTDLLLMLSQKAYFLQSGSVISSYYYNSTLDYSVSVKLKSAVMLSDKSTIIAVGENAFLYRFAFTNDTLIQLNEYPSLGEDRVFNSRLGLFEDFELIVYPYLTDYGSLGYRVANYSKPFDQYIYTDISYSGYTLPVFEGYSNIETIQSQEDSILLAFGLSVTSADSLGTLSLLQVNLSPKLFINPSDSQSDVLLSLQGTNFYYTEYIGKLSVTFVDHSNSTEQVFDHWWFWLLIFVGIVLIFLLIIAILIYIKKRISSRVSSSFESSISLIGHCDL